MKTFFRIIKPKNKIVIYTCIIGGIDNLIEPVVDIPGCDFILFTDRKDIKSKKFKIIQLNDIYKNQRLTSRAPKLLPHFFLQEYEYSLWIDARIILKNPDMGKLIPNHLKYANWAMYKHDERSSIYQEAIVCIEQNKDSKEKIESQMALYAEDGFKDQYSLMMGAIIFRKHMELDVIKTNEDWWYEITHKSIRDQLSFPYVAWKNNLKLKILEGNPRNNENLRILRYPERDALKEKKSKLSDFI